MANQNGAGKIDAEVIDVETKLQSELINLIRASSHRFSKKFYGRYEYWDFFGDGVLILSLCFCKWRQKDPKFEDQIGFKKYFKTSLFNKFRQLEIAAFSKKRAGIKVPLEYASQASCDGGFGEVFFRELVDYVLSFLDSRERQVFSLIVNPPEELLVDALYEDSRRQKIAIICRTYGSRSVRVSCKCLRRFLVKKGNYMSESEFFKILHSVRKVVGLILRKEEEIICPPKVKV